MGAKLQNLMHWLRAEAPAATYGYDCVSADAIYANVKDPAWVAGYIDGPYTWSAAEWALFPNANHVAIATQADVNDGDVLDVENYDATPPQTYGWIRMRKAAGLYRPTVYCSLDNVPAVRVGTGPYKLGTDYDLWVADWTGVPHVAYEGAIACQYQNLSWCDRDVSYDAQWPHRTAPAASNLTRYVSTGTVSLATAAEGYRVSAYDILISSLAHLTPANVSAMEKYLTLVGVHNIMPVGLVYWVES